MQLTGPSPHPGTWRPPRTGGESGAQLIECLEREPYAAHLVAESYGSEPRGYDDFLWAYHGRLEARDPPRVERDDIEYDEILASMFTATGLLVHAREAMRARLDLDDPKRYFVATLDLETDKLTEWKVVRVETETPGNGFSGTTGLPDRELYLTDRPFKVPAGQESPAEDVLEEVLSDKRSDVRMLRALARLPRLKLGSQRAVFLRDNLAEGSIGGMWELNQAAGRILSLEREFGGLALWSSLLDQEQETPQAPARSAAKIVSA
jgi:hypothetical protein